MKATKTHEEAQMVEYRDGYYQPIGDAPVESWDAVLEGADDVEHVETLAGWGDWTDAYRVECNGCTLYYFAR